VKVLKKLVTFMFSDIGVAMIWYEGGTELRENYLSPSKMTRNNTEKEQATAQSLSDCVQLQSELKEIKLKSRGTCPSATPVSSETEEYSLGSCLLWPPCVIGQRYWSRDFSREFGIIDV